MKECRFIVAEELDNTSYEVFHKFAGYEKEHPLHRLHEYVMQYFGGIREDVLEFFCDSEAMEELSDLIGEGQDPGLKNEWYRRLVRLLQCNAGPDWYRMFCIKAEEKPKGYVQYFLNQLASYAELGVPAELVRRLFTECNAAYLLEYKVRQTGKEEEETCEERQMPAEGTSIEQMLQPLLEGQRKVQDMLELMLQGKAGQEEREGIQKGNSAEEECAAKENSELPSAGPDIVPEKTDTKKETMEEADGRAKGKEAEERRERAYRRASLFQQVRIKRKSVQLRKMDQKRQLQELIVKMTQEKFTTEDMGIVRGLIGHDISLEFIYTVISEEKESAKKLKQMYEFLSYQPET